MSWKQTIYFAALIVAGLSVNLKYSPTEALVVVLVVSLLSDICERLGELRDKS